MAQFVRVVTSLVTGLAVFTGLLSLLAGANFTQRLDDSQAYAAAFSETGAYERIYRTARPAEAGATTPTG